MDRLVARRGDADRLAARDQVGDQPARRPRLARAGRPLDHEVPAVERAHERLHLVEVGRLHRRGRTARGRGSTRAPGSGRRPRAASGRSARARSSCACVSNGPPGISASRQRDVRELGPRLSTSRRCVAIERDELARRAARRRVEHVLPLPELVLLRRERERVRQRALRTCSGSPTGSSPPIDSASSSSSSGVISSRSKNPHQTGLRSRSW